MRFVILLLPLLFAAPDSFTQTASLRGSVLDAATGEPLAAANVRVLGTSRGTITNSAGEYSLTLGPGDYRFLFTMLGYAPDTVSLRTRGDMRQDVRMRPSDIVLPEIVVTPEDPAIGIIRRAIDDKQKWIDRLNSYEMHAFTRQTIFRDTAVAAINESYTHGYWQKGDTLREIVTQRRQTANVPQTFNFASVGRIINFAEDNIGFLGFTFVGPTARNALEYYDYKLLRTRGSGGNDLYEIRMIPRTRTVPLFAGTVTIAGGSYALVGVDVQPNEAFQVPFTKDVHVRYRQEFGLYESSYWMPADIRIEGTITVKLLGVSIPRIGITQTSVISDYSINTAIPDSVFKKPRFVVDSSAVKFDSTYWAANTVLPLDSAETRAYRTLDSTQSLDVQFRAGGAVVSLGGSTGVVGTILSNADVTFNRVEGARAGAAAVFDSVTNHLSLNAGLAYGFSDKLGKYSLGFTYYTNTRRSVGIGAGVYRAIDHAPDRGYYSPLTVGLSAVLGKQDYQDYYRAEGGKAFLDLRPSSIVHSRLTYTLEDDSPVARRTNFSIFYPSQSYRANPPAAGGRLSDLRIDFRLGPDPVPFDLILQDALDITVEHASPGLTGGDFDFTRYDGVLSLNIPTFAQGYLLKPEFRIRASAGGSSGNLPVQRLFSIESTLDGFSPFGVMHGAHPREFTGTGYAALSVEHNFRNLPFLALGIPFLYENSIEIIIFGGAARTWGGNGAPVAGTHGVYSEAGLGISRIFDIFRTDFAWRLAAPRGFYFSFGVASIL